MDSFAVLFQSVTDPTGGFGDLIATYGPFAPFAALLLWIMQLLWKDNKAKEAEIKRLTETAMEKVLPIVLEASRVLTDANDAVTKANVTGAEITRLTDLIKDLMRQIEDLSREISRVPTSRPAERT